MVDAVVGSSFKKGISLDSLFPMVKDVLFFKATCEAIIKNKKVPAESDFESITKSLLNNIYGKNPKAKAAIDRVSASNDKTNSSSLLSPSSKSSSDQTSASEQSMSEDSVLLKEFFTNLIKDELRACLAPFGLPKETLKKE